MVHAPVFELRGSQIENALPSALGQKMDHTEQILIRVAEAHSAPDTGFEIRRAARQVERDRALVRIPEIDHAVELGVAGFELVARKQLRPMAGKSSHGLVD